VNRARWRWLQVGLGVVVLTVLVVRVGGGPFLAGARTIDAWTLAAGVAIAVPTTVCCAWRWSLVARGLGVGIPLPAAVAAYYRSQFLNTVLPGGVLGDLHRGVSHGRAARDTGGGVRAVVWERVAGQTVQVTATVAVLTFLPSPAGWPWLLVGGLALTAGGVLVLWVAGVRRHWPAITAASLLALTGHVTTFLVAARTAGVSAMPGQLLPLALLVLVAMAVPANLAGWGPREGMAAWAFGAAGLGASQGVSTAVVYGVMAFVASLPGVVVLVLSWRRTAPPRQAACPAEPRDEASRRVGGSRA
jgi:glycosyltransferase 2 family protein